ncbi:hypothetical protein M413DRAFT_279988 [Hebeloma cylindrosporum]|uniref:Uncharacterized protein n=1 Tax=Hebeloma cylindrosporum TaxID=76867 RepID=A0A0C3BJR5_HEBCY|nr:hypothetical protein M413DRAFT_279988 [Hebeloma cylindrosporum h7]
MPEGDQSSHHKTAYVSSLFRLRPIGGRSHGVRIGCLPALNNRNTSTISTRVSLFSIFCPLPPSIPSFYFRMSFLLTRRSLICWWP